MWTEGDESCRMWQEEEEEEGEEVGEEGKEVGERKRRG